MATQTNTSSSSYTTRWTYDVFLSFRGKDTRRNFTDHLYAALNRKGIFTFRDDEQLKKGKDISQDLLKAIEESRFVIVILSRNYADSTWCLDELAKTVECMKVNTEQTVLPVFYDVDPSQVRKQTGNFQGALWKHEQAFKDNPEKVKRWRDALSEVGSLSGWHLRDGYESKVIEDIVQNSFTQLNQTMLSVSKELVAVELQQQQQVEEAEDYLDSVMESVMDECRRFEEEIETEVDSLIKTAESARKMGKSMENAASMASKRYIEAALNSATASMKSAWKGISANKVHPS